MFYLLPLVLISVILKTSKSLNLPRSLTIPLPRLLDLPFTYDDNFVPDYQELFGPLSPKTPHSDLTVQIPSQLEVSIKRLPSLQLETSIKSLFSKSKNFSRKSTSQLKVLIRKLPLEFGNLIVRLLSRSSYFSTRSLPLSADLEDVTRGSPEQSANAEDSIRRFSQSENSENPNQISPAQSKSGGYPLRRSPSLLDLSGDSIPMNLLQKLDSTVETLSQSSFSFSTPPLQSEYQDKTLRSYEELNRGFPSRSVNSEDWLTKEISSQSSDTFSFDPSTDSTRNAPSLTDDAEYSIGSSDSSNLPPTLPGDGMRTSVSQSKAKAYDLTGEYSSQSYDSFSFHPISQSASFARESTSRFSDSLHPVPTQSPDSLVPPPAQYEDSESSIKRFGSQSSTFIESFIPSFRGFLDSVNVPPPPSHSEYQDKNLQSYDTGQAGAEMRFLGRMPYYVNSTRNFDNFPSEDDDLISMPSQTEDSFNINRVRNIWSALKCLQSNSLPNSYISESKNCDGLHSIQA